MSKGGVSIIKLDKKSDDIKIKRISFVRRLLNKFRSNKPHKGKKRRTDESHMTLAKKMNEARIQKREWAPVTKETRWECQRCGWCCRQNWRVNVTWKEYDRLNGILNIDQVVVDQDTGMSHPLFEITDACVCLNTKKNICKIHSKWPYSCATFPFGLDPKGKLVYSKWCKGIGEGPVVNKLKTKKKIMKERKRAGMDVSQI